jgi:hypothetical protein
MDLKEIWWEHVLTELLWPRREYFAGICEHSNAPSLSIKDREFFYHVRLLVSQEGLYYVG